MARVVKDPDLKEYQGDAGLAARWLKEMELVEESNEQQAFEKHGERIQKKYKNAQLVGNYNPNSPARVAFNVLWSNNQVLEAALFARLPKVYCERLTENSDPIGRYAARIAERTVTFNQNSQYDQRMYNISQCVQDRLLVGRGQGWSILKSDFIDETDDEGNALTTEEGEAKKLVKPNSERVEFLHLNFCDYLEAKARTQYEVRWRARVMYFTYQECVDEFGEELASKLNYSANPFEKKRKGGQDDEPEFLRQAKIYNIYDLTSKEVLFISPGYRQGPLKRSKDPMKIKDFWCCPIPLLATTTTDSTYPTPDFVIYESLADEMNFVCERLNAITDCVRLVGMVAQGHNKDVKEMLRLDDGQLLPVQNYQAFMDKGGLAAMVNWLPYDNAVAAIPVLEQRFSNLKAMIDEITSMPDIVRGSSDPNDPVYSQQQKAHWTVIKLIKKQQDVQRFCREIARKDAEIIFEFFSDETIWMMSGAEFDTPEEQAMFPQALQLLRDDRLRTFRIDIETDSTIAIDEAQAMESWAKYLEGLNFIFSNVQNVSQYRPELLKPMLESAIGAIRTMRTGRSIEGAWENALEEIETAQKQAAMQPPPPDYEMMKAQNEAAKAQNEAQRGQIEMQKMQMEGYQMQFEQQAKTQELSLDYQKLQQDFFLGNKKLEIDGAKTMTTSEIDRITAEVQAFTAQFKHDAEVAKLQLEAQRLQYDKQAKMLEMEEKFMEEKRLEKDERVETLRVIAEHKAAIAAAHLEAKAIASQPSEPAEKPQPPVINVHVGGGKKRIKKEEDGSYTSEEVREEA